MTHPFAFSLSSAILLASDGSLPSERKGFLMVSLRKDVKVGLSIGGIVLAVVVVYFMLSAVSNDPSTPTAMNTGPTTTETAVVTPASTPAVLPPTIASSTPASSTPTATTPASSSVSADPWAAAFETGQIVAPTTTSSPVIPVSTAGSRDVLSTLDSSGASNIGWTTIGSTSPSTTTTTPVATNSNPTAARPAVTAETTHAILPGETFSSLAQKYYGDAKLYRRIVNANPDIDPRRLKVGMKVKIPAGTAAATPDAGEEAVVTLDDTRQYRVQPNDSLHAIAQRLYGDANRWAKIYELNRTVIGADPARLKVGMVLTLPEAPTKR